MTDRPQCQSAQDEVNAVSNCQCESMQLETQFEYLFDICAYVSCPYHRIAEVCQSAKSNSGGGKICLKTDVGGAAIT